MRFIKSTRLARQFWLWLLLLAATACQAPPNPVAIPATMAAPAPAGTARSTAHPTLPPPTATATASPSPSATFTSPAPTSTPEVPAVGATPLPAAAAPPVVVGQPVHLIPLDGPAAAVQSELSGLAWHGDTLILLPQYPGRFGNGEDGAVFALGKEEILAHLDGDSGDPLLPQEIPLVDSGLSRTISGFEGFEAIAFDGDRVFLAVEARPGPGMMGYLVAGDAAPDLSAIRLDPATLAEIPPQADLSNMSDEALLLAGGRALTLYEANGARVNPDPVAHMFDLGSGLEPAGSEPFPVVEYRITDATALDAAGRFWAINYLFPGDLVKLVPAEDQVAETFGIGASHVGAVTVERLLEFQVAGDGITFSGSPPLWLSLSEEDGSRNWEGVVRLDDRGFLLVTDSFPETLFAFVPLP